MNRASSTAGRGHGAARWVVFSTFDPSGRACPSAVDQIRSYRELGFDVLVVDTSDDPGASRLDDWQREATCWFRRPNVGYDFGSFKAGLRFLLEEGRIADRTLDLLIANDSCFGPFLPLGPIFERFDGFPADERRVFGISDSVQGLPHIQSYWMYFRADTSPLAFDFFERMPDPADRVEAIRSGELGLGQFLTSQDCRLEVLCQVRATVARFARFGGWWRSTLEFLMRRALKRWKYNRDADSQCLRHLLHLRDRMPYFNPVVLFGVQLHRDKLSPFLKKSMFRENVYRDPAIPPGIDPATMTNDEVRALLRQGRPHDDRSQATVREAG